MGLNRGKTGGKVIRKGYFRQDLSPPGRSGCFYFAVYYLNIEALGNEAGITQPGSACRYFPAKFGKGYQYQKGSVFFYSVRKSRCMDIRPR